MPILVINCFDWVGFHIVNDLLDNGYKVVGVNLTSSKHSEHLAMQVGRNSHFKAISITDISDSYSVIILNSYEHVRANKIFNKHCEKNTFTINNDKISSKLITFKLLFGEWMQMNNEGMYLRNQYIPFESTLFSDESLYISFLTNKIIKLVRESATMQILRIELKDSDRHIEQILVKKQSIRDNVPKEDHLEKVLLHYQRFKNYY